MKMMFSPPRCGKYFLAFLTMVTVSTAQLNVSGYLNPYGLFRTSNGGEISLPFRLAQTDLIFSSAAIDLNLNLALETRWSTGEWDLVPREWYLSWYPKFGEIRLGKQIHAWGAADGNNPTDNLNAYDFYYLFLPGVDRKLGALSAGLQIYLPNGNLELIVTPEHRGNRFPYDEPDFPLAPPEPDETQLSKVENPLEYGIRFQQTIGENDVSISYFKGYDRGFYLSGIDFTLGSTISSILIPVQYFAYRSTQVYGADFVSFIGDFTLRGEIALFRTDSEQSQERDLNFESRADYTQVVLQVEFTDPLDIQWSGQFIGNEVLDAEGTIPKMEFDPFMNPRIVPGPLTKEEFIPGMGTPFAMFADRGLMVSANLSVMDGRLDIQGTSFVRLEEKGYMFGSGMQYSPVENLKIELGITYLVGDENDPDNAFTRLENFSHVNLGLKYSF